ncbi:MAG: sigma-70 family RNA polymerase sigma factor [Fimbriimonadaceae bacterium]|nr:sigma-70 family RNA polymerase sigma factor [Fimbriimonadaceae bacterium]QYK59140.1 MAG: sigma-70 family RNA polymerase sigma factor [Fimbriimonadaceae bacterium]
MRQRLQAEELSQAPVDDKQDLPLDLSREFHSFLVSVKANDLLKFSRVNLQTLDPVERQLFYSALLSHPAVKRITSIIASQFGFDHDEGIRDVWTDTYLLLLRRNPSYIKAVYFRACVADACKDKLRQGRKYVIPGNETVDSIIEDAGVVCLPVDSLQDAVAVRIARTQVRTVIRDASWLDVWFSLVLTDVDSLTPGQISYVVELPAATVLELLEGLGASVSNRLDQECYYLSLPIKTLKEAASLLGCSVGTLKSRKNRLRKAANARRGGR